MSPQDIQLLASGNFISISTAAKATPYSAEYLSLLARKGKLKAVKMNRDWITTPQAVSEYLEKQAKKHSSMAQKYQRLADKQAGFAGAGVLAFLALAIFGVSGFIAGSLTGISPSHLIKTAEDQAKQFAFVVNSQQQSQATKQQLAMIQSQSNSITSIEPRGPLPDENSVPQVSGKVLDASTTQPSVDLSGMIKSILDQYIAEGKFSQQSNNLTINQGTANQTLPQNDASYTGVAQNTDGHSTLVVGGNPTVGYYPPSPANYFSGSAVLGANDLSANNLVSNNNTLNNATIGSLTVTNGTSLATTTISGTLTASHFSGDGSQLTGTSQWLAATSTSGIYYSLGNVGIGTTTPTEKLVVKGNILTLGEDAPVLVSSTSTSAITANVPWKVYVYGKFAYVTFLGASGNFAIYNIANPSQPVFVAATTTPSLAYDISVSGNYAYVSSRSGGQIYIYDISNPQAMVFKATVNANFPFTSVISGKYLVALGQGSQLIEIFDISDPANPVLTSSLNSGIFFPRGLSVVGKYAYATGQNGGNTGQLNIFDISNPYNIVAHATTTWVYGNTNDRAFSNYVSGGYAYVSAYDSGTGLGQLNIFDVSNPDSIVAKGFTTTNAGSSQRIIVSGKYAYMVNGADAGNSNISVYDISDPNNILPKGVSANFVGGKFYSMDISGKYAYVADAGNGGALDIYEINNTETPSLLAGDINASFANFDDSVKIGNYLNVQGGLSVGPQGALLGGNLTGQGLYNSFSGNLAVGTTSTASTLFVQGSGTSTPLIVASSTGAILFTVSSNGNVGIGTTSPQYLLQVGSSSVASGTVARFQNANGTCDVNPTTNTLACSSDERLKTNINNMTDGFNNVMQLQPVYFNWNAESTGTPEHPGFIAQQVQKIMPEVVSTDPDSGLLSIGYSDLVPSMVGAMQQMQQEITTLQGGLTGNATTSNLSVYSPANFSGDSVGEARIIQGQTWVRISFSQAYHYQPVVTITPDSPVAGSYWTSEKDANGFTLTLSQSQIMDVTFDWHSFASPNEQLTVSDGSKSAITLVVINQSSGDTQVLAGATSDNNASSSTPDSLSTSTPDSTASSTPDTSTSTPTDTASDSSATSTPDSNSLVSTSTPDGTALALPVDNTTTTPQ